MTVLASRLFTRDAISHTNCAKILALTGRDRQQS